MTTTGPAAAGAIPRVSIVVPAYNRERYLGPTLDSVLAQTLSSWEVVVYDDGSSDATAAVAKAYAEADPRIRASGGPNGGVAAARNRGLARTDARSEFVIFLDSDDIWEPDALETLTRVLDAHPEYSSSHSVARCIDSEGRPLAGDDLEERSRQRMGFTSGRLMPVELDEPTAFGDLACHNWVLTPGTHLIRRRAVERAGDFDVETDPADDWDMAIRVSRFGDIGFVDRPLLQWRRHPDTLTNTSPRWRRAYFLVRRRMLVHPANTPEQTRAARLGFVHANRAAAQAARQCLANRQYREALREGAKAAQQYLLYLGADVQARLGRSRPRSGGARTLNLAD